MLFFTTNFSQIKVSLVLFRYIVFSNIRWLRKRRILKFRIRRFLWIQPKNPLPQNELEQSIVGTELFPFNSRSVHVHERNFGHFFKGNSVMNVNGTLVTFSQWTECKSLFIFSVRAEHIFAKKAFETFLSKHIFHFFLKKSFGFKCCWIIKQINFCWITKWHHP